MRVSGREDDFVTSRENLLTHGPTLCLVVVWTTYRQVL